MSAVRVTVAVACEVCRNGTFIGSSTVCFQAMPGDFCGDGREGRRGTEVAVVGRESEPEDVGGLGETATRRSTICSESSVRSTSAVDAEDEDERRPGLKMDRMLGPRKPSCGGRGG